jgi:hypothetical protein
MAKNDDNGMPKLGEIQRLSLDLHSLVSKTILYEAARDTFESADAEYRAAEQTATEYAATAAQSKSHMQPLMDLSMCEPAAGAEIEANYQQCVDTTIESLDAPVREARALASARLETRDQRYEAVQSAAKQLVPALDAVVERLSGFGVKIDNLRTEASNYLG